MKIKLTSDEIEQILQSFNLGNLLDFRPFDSGTVQTNVWIQTSLGRYVLRYYGNRARESVLFETDLLRYLKDNHFPCPGPYVNICGELVGTYKTKPYAVFEFMEGEHIRELSEQQRNQLIQKAAELHTITENYVPTHKESRWNYSAQFCLSMAQQASQHINTENSRHKLSWLEKQLQVLDLPESLPMGICHSDFNLSNILFTNDEFRALLDFDDANYTYLVFDLVGLIESFAWRRDVDTVLNFNEARKVVSEYVKWRPLCRTEEQHLFDVYKLSVLIDCVWYFDRGDATDFYEKRKINFLNTLGREQFYYELFNVNVETNRT